MKTVNQAELKAIHLSPVDYIVANWQTILEDKKDQALVCVIDTERTGGNGYLLGLATKDERGYKSLGMVLEEHNYDIANEWVNEANKIIFNRSAKATYLIVLSSMRG